MKLTYIDRRFVQVGQKWRRKNGNIVELTRENQFGGVRKLELSPVSKEGKPRKSWLSDVVIANQLEYIE